MRQGLGSGGSGPLPHTAKLRLTVPRAKERASEEEDGWWRWGKGANMPDPAAVIPASHTGVLRHGVPHREATGDVLWEGSPFPKPLSSPHLLSQPILLP